MDGKKKKSGEGVKALGENWKKTDNPIRLIWKCFLFIFYLYQVMSFVWAMRCDWTIENDETLMILKAKKKGQFCSRRDFRNFNVEFNYFWKVFSPSPISTMNEIAWMWTENYVKLWSNSNWMRNGNFYEKLIEILRNAGEICRKLLSQFPQNSNAKNKSIESHFNFILFQELLFLISISKEF